MPFLIFIGIKLVLIQYRLGIILESPLKLMPVLYLLSGNLTQECEDFYFFRGIVRLAEIVYTNCTALVIFPSGDNLGRYDVRNFPSVVLAAIGIREL
jgi:hypothetical protein